MATFFTADMHFGHENIIKHCERPFKNADHMHEHLIRNWNFRVKPEDTVYHLGDFCFKGGKIGGVNKSIYWEEQLNGKVIHVLGNHDINNSVKSIMTHAVFSFGNKIILGQHKPPSIYEEVPEFVDYVLCGHVHQYWKHMILDDFRNEKIPIPVINVGVDVWDFAPVSLQEIIVYYDKIMKNS